MCSLVNRVRIFRALLSCVTGCQPKSPHHIGITVELLGEVTVEL